MEKETKTVFVIGYDHKDTDSLFKEFVDFVTSDSVSWKHCCVISKVQKYVGIDHLKIHFYPPDPNKLRGKRCDEVFGYNPVALCAIVCDPYAPRYPGPLFSYVLEELGGK